MTPFEVGIWQAAFATAREDHAEHAAEMVEEFRLLVAQGEAGLPVTEGNVCGHAWARTIKDGILVCTGCGASVVRP